MATPPQIDPATRWRLVEDLFHRASELPASDRTAFLVQACPNDPTLLDEVLELLHADSAVAEKIAPPASEAQSSTQSSTQPEHLTFRTSNDSWLQRTLGHYTVLSELGRGGMGVVYLGRRNTPGPHQQAALKVVRRNLQDSPALKHFLLERDALARLEHPNIARLLDGGVTPEGIPWVALEFVEGQRLDHFVEEGRLSIQTILNLVIQLCAAVGYVHRNLILHRDLKPGNVMVTPQGVVKLLDFGTLKVLQADFQPGAQSDMTQAGMRPVTLRFASPEHVHGHRVSTASDVYSLGIILYRLIAGRFPEASPEHTDASSSSQPHKPFQSPMTGFFEDLREDRFQPPSAFSSLDLPSELARDLDAITMKAIRFNAADRYQTADALSAELTRALENQPVEARGNNRAYLARKFYTRHAAALWTAFAALFILAIGLAGIAHETRVARAQQARAELGVDQERKLAHLLLFDITPRVELITTTPVQKELVAKVSQYLDSLNTGLAPDPELQLDQIQGYRALSSVLGNPYSANLGDTQGAIREVMKAIAIASPMLRQQPDNVRLLDAQLNNQTLLGGIYFGDGDIPHAVTALGDAEALERPILAHHDLSTKVLTDLAYSESKLSDLNMTAGFHSLGNVELATQHQLRAIELHNQVLASDPHAIASILGIESSYFNLGVFVEDTHPQIAIGYFQQGLDEAARLTREESQLPRSRRINRGLNDNLGATETDIGLVDQGLARLARSRDASLAALQKDPLDEAVRIELLLVDINSSIVLTRINRPHDAVPILQEAVALTRQLLAHHQSEELMLKKAQALLILYLAATDTGETAISRPARDEGLPILLEIAGKPGASPIVCFFAAHVLDIIGGDPAQALSFAQRSTLAGTPGPDEWIERAIAESRVGDNAAAEADARHAATLLVGTTGGFNQFRKEEIRRLLHQPPVPADPNDQGPVYTGKAIFQDFHPPHPAPAPAASSHR